MPVAFLRGGESRPFLRRKTFKKVHITIDKFFKSGIIVANAYKLVDFLSSVYV